MNLQTQPCPENRETRPQPTATAAVAVQRGVRRLVLKNCGKHYGENGGECSKCRAIANDSPVAGALLAVFNATFYPNKI